MYINYSTQAFQTGAMRRCLFGSEVCVYIYIYISSVPPKWFLPEVRPSHWAGCDVSLMSSDCNSFVLALCWHSVPPYLTCFLSPCSPLRSLCFYSQQDGRIQLPDSSSQKQQQNFWPSHVSTWKLLLHDPFNFWLHLFGIHCLWRSVSPRPCRLLCLN